VTTLREVKSVDYGFNEYIFPEFDSEFKETQDMTQQVSMQTLPIKGVQVLPRKGTQALIRGAQNDYTKVYEQPPKSGLGEGAWVLQDLDHKSISGILSRPMRGAREGNKIVNKTGSISGI
jgi:hypothetical protein